MTRLEEIKERVDAAIDDQGILTGLGYLKMIKHAGEDVPWLIEEVERLQNILDDVRMPGDGVIELK